MCDINKFQYTKMTEVEGLKVLDDSLGYVICEIVDAIDNDTHTLFIGRLIEADVYKDEEPMTYGYYQNIKKNY